MKLKEIKSLRQIYGNDKNAINRHSSRVYEDAETGEFFEIDKTLDGVPPFYELLSRSDLRRKVCNGLIYYESTASKTIPIFPEQIVVNGEPYWGSGITWRQAVLLAQKAIEQWYSVEV
jgi:hypothetical protein